MSARPRCDGWKRCYPSWRWARNDARAIGRKESGEKGRPEAYWCADCRCVHVGHRADKRQPRERSAA